MLEKRNERIEAIVNIALNNEWTVGKSILFQYAYIWDDETLSMRGK
jgi:hypothetical protein